MSMSALLLTVLAVAQTGGAAPATVTPPVAGLSATTSATVARRPGEIEVSYCLITPLEYVRLSAGEAGPLVEIPVREGSEVGKGDLLARVDDSAAQIKKKAAHKKWEVANMQANTDVTVDAAKAAAEVAKADHQANIDIEKRRPNTVSKAEYRKTELNAVHSIMKIEVAELEFAMAKLTADAEAMAEEAADEEIARRRLLSPIGGVVDRVLAQVGEWVQPGQPIVEVVRLDKLRLETSLDPYDVSPREIVGRQVEIEVPVGGGQVEKFSGKIGFVSPVVIADRYRVTVDFDNRKVDNFWAVTPGLQATMKIKLLPAGRQLSGAPVSKSAP